MSLRDELAKVKGGYRTDKFGRQVRSRSKSFSRSRSRSSSSSSSGARYKRRRRSRSRSKSPEKSYRGGGGGNSYVGNVTNSDDPKLLSARVFIGNLPTDKMTRQELEQLFIKYGRILGVSVLKGFGFVQYSREEEAKLAVRSELGSMFKGNRLDVKMAIEGRNKKAFVGGRGRGDGRPTGLGGYRARSPPPHPGGAGYYERPHAPPYERYEYRGGGDPWDHYYRRSPQRQPPPPRSYNSDANLHCKLLLLDATCSEYAESIERRLRNMGMQTDLHLLSAPDVLPTAMDDIYRQKLPYAIVLNGQNSSHASLTLNILHGTPQEHRNMPLEDAMKFISRNFDSYMTQQSEPPTAYAPPAAAHHPPARRPPPSSGGSHPPEFVPPDQHTSYLLNLLADQRILTIEELDIVMLYLDRRKERMLNMQGGPPARPPPRAPPRNIEAQQAHIENKIFSLLNGGGESAASNTTTPANPGPAVDNGSNIDFENPGVKQALNTLMGAGGISGKDGGAAVEEGYGY